MGGSGGDPSTTAYAMPPLAAEVFGCNSGTNGVGSGLAVAPGITPPMGGVSNANLLFGRHSNIGGSGNAPGMAPPFDAQGRMKSPDVGRSGSLFATYLKSGLEVIRE